MKPPMVAIVMPVHNGGANLPHALDSVAGQSVESWECIIVDDGSSDGSQAIAERWAKSVPQRVQILQHADGEQRGVAATRNLALQRASARWVAFLDQDDLWRPDKLKAEQDFLSGHPELAAASCTPEVHYEGEEPKLYVDLWVEGIRRIGLRDGLARFKDFLVGCPFFMSGTIVDRDELLSIGGFREDLRFTSDWLAWGCLASRKPLGVNPEQLAIYRVHGRNDLMAVGESPCRTIALHAGLQHHLAEWIAAERGISCAYVWQQIRKLTTWDYDWAAFDEERAEWFSSLAQERNL